MAAKALMLPATRIFNSNTAAIPGATASLYTTGTTTPQLFYADADLSVSLGNTIRADGIGQLPNCYQEEDTAFRLILRDSLGNTIDGGDIDPFHFGSAMFGTITTASGAAVPSRALLAAIASASDGRSAILTESGREGSFVFVSSDLSAKVTADTAQGIYVAPSTDTSGASGAWVRKNTGFWKPEWFGTTGDGSTNDHTAFRAVKSLSDAVGFLHLDLAPMATYLVGKQASGVDEQSGNTYYQASEDAIYASGLASVIIRGNGSTLKTNSGLKFGGFDPATGLPKDHATTNRPEQANIGHSIYLVNCARVAVSDINLDGNSAAHTIGGTTGADGNQARHIGLMLDGYTSAFITNVSAKNFLLDGFNFTNSGLVEGDDAKPLTVIGLISENHGRNCVSVLGCSGVSFINYSVRNPGNAPVSGGGVFGAVPMSCFDIEGGTNVNRGLTLMNGQHIQGPHGLSAFVADSGDTKGLRVLNGKFVGNTVVNQFAVSFDRCRFFGFFGKLKGSTDPALATSFENCEITDETLGSTPLQSGTTGSLMFDGVASGNGIRMVDCRITATRLKPSFVGMVTRKVTYNVAFGTEYWADGATMMLTANADHERMQINDAIAGTLPANAYIVTITNATFRDCNMTSAGGKLKWIATGASGFTGQMDNYSRAKDATGQLTDAATTIYARASARTQVLNVALTANRALTLNTVSARDGDEFLITRTAASTGAFSLNVGTGPLKALATSTWCRVVYDGTAAAWRLAAYGAL